VEKKKPRGFEKKVSEVNREGGGGFPKLMLRVMPDLDEMQSEGGQDPW